MYEENCKIISKRTNCPVCKSSSLTTLFSIERNSKSFLNFLKIERFYSKRFWDDYYNGLFNELIFEIVKCDICNLTFQLEVLNETGMSLLYNDWLDQEMLLHYYNKNKPVKYQENILSILGKTLKSQNDLKTLDYGAGYGGFCALSLKYGYNTFAYELSKDKSNYISSEMGVITINDLDNYNSFFDFIHLNQVMEHVSNPLEILITLQGCLRKNGIIFMSVPNCQYIAKTIKKTGLSKELFGQLSPYQHINAFNNKTLIKLAKLSGLQAFDLIDFIKLFNKNLLATEISFLLKTFVRSFYGTSLFFRK